MSLENRVETLEHELKILKNEIESTLLEIQNQVLIHYYPAFRAEESVTSRDQLPFVKVPASVKSPAAQGNEPANSHPEMDVAYVLPKTQEVSLDAINGKPNKSPLLQQPATRFQREVVALDDDEEDDEEDNADDDPDHVTAPATVIDQLSLTRLARWVNHSVEKIGKTRTQEMIDATVGTEYGTPAVTAALHQLLAMSEDEEPPTQVDMQDLMNVLLKFNKVLDQVAKATPV